jgi:gliding motility-associated-like protein
MQTLTVTIANPLTPTLTIPGPLCNTANTVNLNAVPGGGTWTNNGGVSAGGILTPALAPIGTSSVLYSTVVGSCIATSTAAINVSQFNTAAFTTSIAPMCVTSPIVNLNSIVQSTVNGTWSGVNVNNNSFNPSGLSTNIYTLTYNTTSSPNATLCPDVNSIAISVLNPPTPTISAIGPYCNTAGNIQMIVSPNSGTWTPVVYQTPTGIFSPSQAAIGSNTVQYVIGTFTCNTQATSTINVEAFVPAVITGSISDKCNTASQVNLTPLVVNNTGTWSGPGVTGSVFDPSASGTGNLTLTYNTNSSPVGLCPDQATLAVNVFSLATPVITQIGPFCNMHGAVMIPVTPLGGYFSSSGNGAVNNQGLFVPPNASIGQNIINYSVSAGPCVATAQTTINIEAFVSADFTKYAGPFCKNDPPINLNSIVQNQGGTWSGPTQVNGLFTPANANIGNNNIVIYYTNSSPTPSLCPDSSAMRIQVSDIPQVNVVSNVEKGCRPVEVTFNTPSANSGIGTWNFGDGSSTQNGLTANHTFDAPGSYTISFTYINDMGCGTQAVLPYAIKVFDVPHAAFSFSPEEVSMIDPKIQFTNLSTILGNNTYQWQIADKYQLNDVNPQVIFDKAGDYMITLTAKTPEGCKDITSQRVTIRNDYGVYVPNSFTPNYDGVNDIFIPVFSPYGLDLNVYDLEIFDRWGASLFHTKDYTVGWDGLAKGTSDPVKQDVYVYRIKYKDAEGKIYHKTGHVSLLK